jgi:NodT family efflux transporter outer membrane factor (OMF) lipoprotein
MRKPLAIMLALALLLTARAQAQEAQAQEAQETAFWQRIGDSTLVRLTGQALAANHDIKAAGARLRQAQVARRQAAFDFAPTITVAGSYTQQHGAEAVFGSSVPDGGLWDAEARLSWEVDVFGRLRQRYKGLGRLEHSVREAVRDVRLELAAEVASAYFDLRGAQEQLAVARRNAENQRGTLQLTRDLLEAGRGDDFDTERALAQLNTTLARIPVLEASITASASRLAVLLGVTPDAASLGIEPEQGFPELPSDVPVTDPDALIRARPDVRAAQLRLDAEHAFVSSAQADYLPRLTVGGSAGFTAASFDDIGGAGTGRYVIGPVISWPALNLGRVKTSVDAARALESEAQAHYEQTVLDARGELAGAVATYTGARNRVDRLAAAAAASSRAAELARLRFESGVEDFLQVLDAERTLLAAEDALARGHAEAAVALVQLYRAMGG